MTTVGRRGGRAEPLPLLSSNTSLGCAPGSKQPVTGLPETAPLARLHAAVGALRPVLNWRRTAPARPHVPPRAVEQAWRGARRRIQAVRTLRLPRSDALPDLPRLGEVPIPAAEHLEATIRDLQRLVRDQARREDAERTSAWKAWLVEEMSVRPGAVYRWLREEGFSPPVVFLARPDGTPTGNVQEMDELLRAAWGPINRKYAEVPESDPAAFLARYGHHLRRVPMLHKPLTGGYLRRRLRFMHPTALGLDGWSLGDLRSLPLRLLDWLAELLTLVEVTGRWPEVLARGYTALIPKPGEEGPLGTRPLTVLSVVYRLWAGTRLWEVLRWQETWAHPEAYGFRPARGALDAAAVTQVLLELSRLKGWTLFGVNLDYVKCFDLIPQAVVLRVGQELGLEPGILRALTGMYRQLRRAFKVSGCLGSWWRATNGILQGCPLSVILINLLTTVWKMEIDEMRRHVVVTTRALPPVHGDQPDMVVHRGAGRAALCPTGYADDTQAMTRTSQDRQDVCDRTAEWLRVTGQDVRPDKSGAWALGATAADAPARLRGLEIPNKDEFRQLGVGIRVEARRGTGPLLQTRMDRAKAILRRIGCIPVLRQRATALGTLALAKALWGSKLAEVGEADMRALDSLAAIALWGPTRVSRNREVLWSVLTPGHRVAPSWRAQYQRLLWLAQASATTGTVQVLVQAVLEERPKPPLTGPVGRALQDTRRLGWVALEGWWKWRLPGQAAPLHLALDDWGEVCHRVRESQRFSALQALERRRPRTYGGLGGAVQRDAVRHALTVACNELELVLLRSQLAGATWTAARAHEHRIRTDPRCPHCGAPAETDEHMLWACPSWEPARAAWRPLVEAAARPLPTLAVPSAWPACLRSAGLLPLALVPDNDALQLAKDLLYRLYGMFLAVLAARKTALDAAQQRGDHRSTVFGPARGRAPDARAAYPWHQLGAGPLPMPPARPPLDAPEGLPPHWPWEATFLHALLRWAGALLWLPGQGQVTYVELALDFEEHAGRALPAAPGHKLAGRVLPLRERAHVLKLALDRTQQFMRAGELLGGQLRPLCNALVPLGGYRCMGRTERPVFACRQAMHGRLEVHCRALWARRLARPGRGRQEAFLNDYLPRPLGGRAPLRPFQRARPQRPRCPPAQPPPPARPAGAPRALGRGLGTVRVLCPAHGAATCAACAATGQGIKYCCSLGHEGHRLAPAAQRAGARALRAWLQAPQQVHPPAPHPGTVLGSRGRESPRGSSEDEPPQARRRVLPPAVLGRRQRPPRVGSSSDDEPPRRRPPPRAGSSLSHSSRDSNPHHPQGYAGGGVGQPQPRSQPRATSLSGSGLISPGGRWLRAPPLAASSATTSLPPPPPTVGASRGGGGGQGQGRASLVDVFGSISAALIDAARADGAQGGPPPPQDREQQGAAGWLRDGQRQGASPPLSDQKQQDAAGQGLGQQGAAGQGLGQMDAARQGLGQQDAAGQGLGQQNAAGQGVGQQNAAGQGLGQQGAAGQPGVQAQGQPEAAALGQGCQGQGQGRGQGGPAPPPPGTTQPPPLPSWGGSTGAGARQCDSGGQGSAWGRPSGAPLAAQGCGSPFAAPRGGALEPWLHSASAVIGRGGRPTPRSCTCTCGRGWGSAQPEVWAGSLLRGSHIGRRPGSFRRAAIRWGGGGGKGLIYLYTAVYR